MKSDQFKSALTDTSYVDLELYQNATAEFNPSGPHDGRTIGDLKITLQYTDGSFAPVSYQQWQPGDKGGTYSYFVLTPPAGKVYPVANKSNIRIPKGAFGWTFYESLQYVISVIDFTALIGGRNLNGEQVSLPFKTLLVRSKSSALNIYDFKELSQSFKLDENEIKFSIFSETLVELKDSISNSDESTVIVQKFDVNRLKNFLRNTDIDIKNKLATSIIETRAKINVIFYEKHKAKLLLLNDERNLSDFYKSANTEEEFTHRVASLGQVSQYLDVGILRSLTQEAGENIKSIQLLEKFLNQIGKQNSGIIEPLQKINRIRQGYPIHADNTGNIAALRDLGISYPIIDYESAWQVLLKTYYSALEKLLQILIEEYSKK